VPSDLVTQLVAKDRLAPASIVCSFARSLSPWPTRSAIPAPCGCPASTPAAWLLMALAPNFALRRRRGATRYQSLVSRWTIPAGMPRCGSLKGGRWGTKW
jgi:hypothetical protein